jgi:hypothetical protein
LLQALLEITEFMATPKVKPMTKPIIFDGEQHREMSDTEHGQWLTDQLQAQENLLIAEAKIEAKLAILKKLGLSDNELNALLS